MPWTNPNGWTQPKTNAGTPPSVPTFGHDGTGTGVPWVPADGIANTDLHRIETNIKGLHTLLCQSGTVDVRVVSPYFTSSVTATWNWIRINTMVFIGVAEMESPNKSFNHELRVEPLTVWPDQILPESEILVPCLFRKELEEISTVRPGYFIMPTGATDDLICYITEWNAATDIDGCMVRGNEGAPVVEAFAEAAGGGVIDKAIPAQTVMYMTTAASRGIASTTTTTVGP